MLLITALFALQLLSLFGLGKIFLKLNRLKEANSGLVGIWGIVFATFLASLWSLFLPLSQLGPILLIVGLAAAVVIEGKKPTLFSILLFLAMIFPIYISTPQYDTGLYHLSQIQIERENPLPIGLANLHSRFSFNSLWLPYAASMGISDNWRVGSFLVNSSLLYFFILLVWEKARFKKKILDDAIVPIFAIVSFSLFLIWKLYRPIDLGGPNTDFPAQLFGIIGLFVFWLHFFDKKLSSAQTGLVLMVFAVLLKFSMVGLVIIPFSYVVWKYRINWVKPRLVVIFGLICLIWVIRSIIISGCLIPLLSETCLPVSWSADEQVHQVTQWVKSWARYPGLAPDIVLNDFSWIRSYWLPMIRTIFWTKLLALLSILLLIKLIATKGNILKSELGYVWILASLGAFFSLWFYGAPDYRFASLLFVFTCFTILGRLIGRSLTHIFFLRTHIILLMALIIFSISITRTWKFRHQLFDNWPRYSTPQSAIQKELTPDITIRSSLSGDQCYDIKWCTPEYSDQIRVTEKWGRLVFTRE